MVHSTPAPQVHTQPGANQRQFLRLDVLHESDEIHSPLLNLIKQTLDGADLYAYRSRDVDPGIDPDGWWITALMPIESNEEVHDRSAQLENIIEPFPADRLDPEVIQYPEFLELQQNLKPFRVQPK